MIELLLLSVAREFSSSYPLLVAADVIVCQQLRAPEAMWMTQTHGSYTKKLKALCQSCNAPRAVVVAGGDVVRKASQSNREKRKREVLN